MDLPAPERSTVQLITGLLDASNHENHIKAIQVRDHALTTHFTETCIQWLCLTYHADRQGALIQDTTIHQIVNHQWGSLGQLSALLLKNALVRPPILADNRSAIIATEHAESFRHGLLSLIMTCEESSNLQYVISTLVASAAVNTMQPALHISSSWNDLFGRLISRQPTTTPIMRTLLKILQDGITAVSDIDLDSAVVYWLKEATTKYHIECLECCIQRMPSSLRAHWDDYLRFLSNASTVFPDAVCRSLVMIVTERSELLDASVLPFVLQTTVDGRLDACDFWLTFATLHEDRMNIGLYETIESNVLPRLIPILLQKMVYSAEEQVEVLADMEEEEEEKPIFHKQKVHGAIDGGADVDDDSDFDTTWNLRKCAAASLDSLAQLYGPDRILPYLLPHVESVLQASDVWAQEAALLAIGAIAEGCYDEMVSFLENGLFQLLIRLLHTPTTLAPLHSIAAWTLSQYAAWIVSDTQHTRVALDILLDRMQHGPSDVQVACVAALGILVEHAGQQIEAFPRVYDVICQALSVQSRKVLLNVLDVYGRLAEACPGQSMLLPGIPKIMDLWNTIATRDPREMLLLPLLESLAALAISLRQQFEPFALSTLENALCMIESLQLILIPEDECSEGDLDSIVCAMDMVDALVEAFEANFIALVQSSARYGPVFGNAVVSLVEHDAPTVRASAWALVGDLARHTPTLLSIERMVGQCAANIDPRHPYLATNAVWACGEICVVLRISNSPSTLQPYVPSIVQSLIALMVGNGIDAGGMPGLAENAASCMGRIALLDPSFCAPDAPRFLLGWCDALGKIEDRQERRDGFLGFAKAIYANPEAVSHASTDVKDTLASILFALVTWHLDAEQKQDASLWTKSDVTFQPLPVDDTELVSSLSKLVGDLKSFVGEDAWHLVLKRLPVNVRRLLREAYSI